MKPVVVCAAIPECAILHPLAARVLERAFGCLTIHSEAADKPSRRPWRWWPYVEG
jgi:hypothetical protein